MGLEQQVCSLELSTKLKELGFEKESLFYWGEESGLRNNYQPRICTDLSKWDDDNMIVVCPAYTVAEMGEMLPHRLKEEARATDYKTHYSLEISKDKTWWEVCYQGGGDAGNRGFFNDASLVNAMAKMLIYLKENNLI